MAGSLSIGSTHTFNRCGRVRVAPAHERPSSPPGTASRSTRPRFTSTASASRTIQPWGLGANWADVRHAPSAAVTGYHAVTLDCVLVQV
jgi:hypothetical protein